MAVALVLGAHGFVGRHVVAALRGHKGLSVLEAVRRPEGVGEGSGDLAFDLVSASLDSISGALRTAAPDVVVNCAGRTTGSASELLAANAVSVARLLEALEAIDIHVRLVHVGSAAEYGAGPVGVPVTETSTARPTSPYGVSKLAATQLVGLASARGVVAGIVLRPFNVLGPGMSADTLPGAAIRVLRRARETRAAFIDMGPLDAVRDFVDVRDTATAVVAASTAGAIEAPVLNIGSGQGHTARELVAELARIVGFHGLVREASPGSPRSGDVPWQVADISLAVRALGWHPAHDLAESCAAL